MAADSRDPQRPVAQVFSTTDGRGDVENAPDVKALVLERFRHAEQTFRPFFVRSVRFYDIYRGWYSGTFQAFRNNVIIPLLFSTVWADVARKVNTSFGVYPFVQMYGYGPEDTAKARKNELLISAQMKDCKTFLKAVDMFLMADLYGTSICQYGWETRTENLIRRELETAPLTGKRFERLKTEQRVTFNGPVWNTVDILDFFPQPGFHHIDEMSWVIRRYWLDMEEVEAMAQAGIFDKAQLEKLKIGGAQRDIIEELKARRTSVRGPFGETEVRRMERFAKPVELLEMWGKVPSEFRSPDGGTERVITVANRTCVLRNRPNPFWHGKKPFIAFSPLNDPHFFHGIGKVEIGERLQLSANRIANQKLDALDLFVDPAFIYDRSKGVDVRNLFMRSGKVIPVDGPPAEAIQALIPNLNGLQNAYQEISDLNRWMQQGTGITEDTVLGMKGAQEQTAREFLGRQENTSIRLLLESRLAEEAWIEPLANGFHSLNRQFLPTPQMIKIIGAAALADPVTGMPAPPENMEIDLDDLNIDYDVRARGATQTIGRAARQQNMVLLLQSTATHPAAMALVNWIAFFRDLFRTFEMGNEDELLNPPPGMQQAIAMANGQMPPEQAPGVPFAPPGGLTGLPGETQEASLEGILSGQ